MSWACARATPDSLACKLCSLVAPWAILDQSWLIFTRSQVILSLRVGGQALPKKHWRQERGPLRCALGGGQLLTKKRWQVAGARRRL